MLKTINLKSLVRTLRREEEYDFDQIKIDKIFDNSYYYEEYNDGNNMIEPYEDEYANYIKWYKFKLKPTISL